MNWGPGTAASVDCTDGQISLKFEVLFHAERSTQRLSARTLCFKASLLPRFQTFESARFFVVVLFFGILLTGEAPRPAARGWSEDGWMT